MKIFCMTLNEVSIQLKKIVSPNVFKLKYKINEAFYILS